MRASQCSKKCRCRAIEGKAVAPGEVDLIDISCLNLRPDAFNFFTVLYLGEVEGEILERERGEGARFGKKLFDLSGRKALWLRVDAEPAKRLRRKGGGAVGKALFKTVTGLISEPAGKKKALGKLFLKPQKKALKPGERGERHHLNRVGEEQCPTLLLFAKG